MSVNQIELAGGAHSFIAQPSEQTLYQSPTRTSFTISSPGNSSTISWAKGALESSAGVVYLTNQRIVYIATHPTPAFESFACPITHVYDSRVTTPWFGPNVWMALVKPGRNGGLPEHNALEVKMTFKDGGAFDFHELVERLKERVLQTMENRGDRQVPLDVHLEDLPTYEDAGNSQPVVPPPPPEPVATASIPNAPPPGYEEVQAESVRHAVEGIERTTLSETRDR